MRRGRNAKVVATLGPSSSTPERIAQLFDAGVDVFRLNFSHGLHEEHAARLKAIREHEARIGRPIGVMADLQGPKLRIATFAEGKATLVAGQRFRLDLEGEPGDSTRVVLPHPEIFAAAEKGTELLLDDGRIRLQVLKRTKNRIETGVLTGGVLSNRKGVNVPGVVLPLSPLTAKDRADMAFALDQGVEWIALSFVQRPADVAEARKLIAGRAGVLVKLEKPAAIQHLDELIDMSDVVMVARGDLGVEMPPEDVPRLQKQIVRACRTAGKPVIVATQMLESMVNAPAPTRAEASDVATAIYDGADAVMLSAETAAGAYPLEAVSIMDRIIHRTEGDTLYRGLMDAEHRRPEATSADAITAAANQVATTISAATIITYTYTGSTALRAARERPPVPILCMTAKQETARRMSVAWGVHAVIGEEIATFAEMVGKALDTAKVEKFAAVGEKVVIVAGVPFGTPGATNILRIAWVE